MKKIAILYSTYTPTIDAIKARLCDVECFDKIPANIDEFDFLEDSQVKLAQDFRNLPAKSLMIIGKTKLTEHLYKPYIKGEYSKKYAVNIRNRFKAESTHLIITNYNLK